MASIALRIYGMDCAEEVAALKAEIAPLPDVRELDFDLLNGKMTVHFSGASATPEAVIAAVAKTGMRAEMWQDSPRRGSDNEKLRGRWQRTAMTAACGLLLGTGLATHVAASGWSVVMGGQEGLTMPLIARFFYLGAIVTGIWYVAPKAWSALLRLQPDMNLLMSIAVAGALVIDEFFEAATVAFLFAVSLALESWSVGRARRAIAALISLTPDEARLVNSNGSETLVAVRTVAVGATVVVLPGESFPLDGKIVKGETTVNQSPITGESVPVAKSPGHDVFAGTINEDGAVEFVTTKPAEDTTLARIIRMVGSAQSKRSPSEQWVERFARLYTPAVMVMAIAVALLPPLLSGEWSKWFYESLVLLVIACPCALVISTPVSIVAALTSAARHGILIKGGPYMEAPSRLRAIAVDKTGTLTEGRPEVHSVVPLRGYSEVDVLTIAAAVEMRSEHPLAKAVVRAAAARGIRPAAAENFQAMKGRGAIATVGGELVWLGSHRLLEERGQEMPEMHEQLEQMEKSGSSAVVVGKNEEVCGLIAVGDRIRPQARAALRQMRDFGIQRIVLLTGDNRGTGEAIGRAAGVDEVRAELLPAGKVAAVEELVTQYGQVAMIGDGVNDAPAMARASLGIAMGAVGTDAALETADIALMSDDLLAIAWLIRHSRRTLVIIRQNIWASLGVKAVFMVLTLIGHASLWSAIAADMGTSLLVVFNGLRLLRPREDSAA